MLQLLAKKQWAFRVVGWDFVHVALSCRVGCFVFSGSAWLDVAASLCRLQVQGNVVGYFFFASPWSIAVSATQWRQILALLFTGSGFLPFCPLLATAGLRRALRCCILISDT